MYPAEAGASYAARASRMFARQSVVDAYHAAGAIGYLLAQRSPNELHFIHALKVTVLLAYRCIYTYVKVSSLGFWWRTGPQRCQEAGRMFGLGLERGEQAHWLAQA